MKTPCLKCGLVHDEPTAICEGYVGIDPDETAGDSRKQAAARIRAILSTVPIESRRQGRARAAAAAAGASASSSPDAVSHGSAPSEPPPAEIPEWRREVTERLESYRHKRERQARQGGTNQSVLEFRVHSKSGLVQEAQEAMAAAPAEVEASAVEPMAASPLPSESSVAPAAMDAATAAPAAAPPQNGGGTPRTYQPIEESEMTTDLTADLAGLVSEVPESGNGAPAVNAELEPPALAEAVDSPDVLPIPSEPAVVLADSATLEVHAEPVELADVQPAEPLAAQPLVEPATLASVPAIDTEYWRNAPSEEEEEPEECGSLTSGFEPPSAAHEEATEPVEEVSLHAEETAQEEIPELSPVAEIQALAGEAEPPVEAVAASEEPAAVLHSEAIGADESLFPAALTAEEQEEVDNRRAALRTAARPLPGPAPERIEIRVPQPVFDFAPATMENQQPQDAALPVADLRERRCAAFLDATLLGFTIAGFFLAFHLAGGELTLSRVGIGVSIVAAFLIYALYVLLFTFVGGATPGMVLRGLRVVSFDGRAPGTTELVWRSFGYLLSAAAGMMGFLWSAWDEHGLSWHDRISQTYITYSEVEALSAAMSMQ